MTEQDLERLEQVVREVSGRTYAPAGEPSAPQPPPVERHERRVLAPVVAADGGIVPLAPGSQGIAVASGNATGQRPAGTGSAAVMPNGTQAPGSSGAPFESSTAGQTGRTTAPGSSGKSGASPKPGSPATATPPAATTPGATPTPAVAPAPPAPPPSNGLTPATPTPVPTASSTAASLFATWYEDPPVPPVFKVQTLPEASCTVHEKTLNQTSDAFKADPSGVATLTWDSVKWASGTYEFIATCTMLDKQEASTPTRQVVVP
jgi:hypothetical protein